jgi:hypothetical protein
MHDETMVATGLCPSAGTVSPKAFPDLSLLGPVVKRSLVAALAVLFAAGAALAQSGNGVPAGLGPPVSPGPAAAAIADPGLRDPYCDLDHSLSCLWGEADSLLWWMKHSPVSLPLVTSGPGNTVALGGHDVSMDLRTGARFTVGNWWDDEQCIGTSATYFFLTSETQRQSVRSGGEPGSLGLALPFFDVTLPGESSIRIAQPGAFAGAAMLSISNEMQGVELNGLARILGHDSLRVHLLGGLRFWQFNEGLLLQTNSSSVGLQPDALYTEDRFAARNNFWGGQIGVQVESRWNSLLLQVQGKVALGGMHEEVNTSGLLITNQFNHAGLQFFPSGYLAQPTNNGFPSRTRWAVLPELNLRVGYQVTAWLGVQVGYTFLYASSLVRPGDQIDRGINSTQSPAITGQPSTTALGPQRPAPMLNSTDFWAQGLTLGLSLQF